MSLDTCRGVAYAYRELMRRAQADIQSGGEIKPAVVKWKTAHPKLTIGAFKARLLRFAARRQA